MKWSMKQPSAGDMIRVRLGNIYHYGIFVSEDEVIQFGLAPSARPELKSEDIEVCVSDIDAFLVGGFLETAEFDRAERKKNRSPKAVVAIARERLGERGYNILYNNCEHFAYECVTGKKYCSQTDDVRTFFKSIPVVHVYFAAIPDGVDVQTVVPKERNDEIERVSNARVRAEKYCVWRLLEYALERSFGYKMRDVRFEKTENGKWICDKCEFSLSHCDGVVAVAVSRTPVGVDVETKRQMSREGFADRILNKSEKARYEELGDTEKEDFLLTVWTQKEGLFKREGGASFSPSNIDTLSAKTRYGSVEIEGREYAFSVATDTPDALRIYSNVDIFKR